jgi:hypothetical protein
MRKGADCGLPFVFLETRGCPHILDVGAVSTLEKRRVGSPLQMTPESG